jgi:hypothetical protein
MTWQTVLKTYQLDEFIVKAGTPKKKAKKGEEQVKVGNSTVNVISSASLVDVIADLEDWHTTCKGLSLADIGVTGRGNQGSGKSTLLEHVMHHVHASVQRPGQGARTGAMDTINDIMKIARSEHAFEKEEFRKVDEFIQDLKDVEGDDETNPRNIPFEVPAVLTRTGIESKKTVHGHYRTPEYVKFRKKFRESSNEMPAVPSKWYNKELNTAEPPFWQALFARGSGTKVTWGILPLLEKFAEEMEEQELSKLHVKGKGQREILEKLKPFGNALKLALQDQTVYKNPTLPFDRLHLNFAALTRKLQETEFLLTTEAESEFVKKVTGHGDLVGTLESFFIDKISIQLLRTMITNTINLDTFKHGQYAGIFLYKPITVAEKRKKLFNREKARAKKDGNLPGWLQDDVKKSWSRTLWRY